MTWLEWGIGGFFLLNGVLCVCWMLGCQHNARTMARLVCVRQRLEHDRAALTLCWRGGFAPARRPRRTAKALVVIIGDYESLLAAGHDILALRRSHYMNN